MSKFVRSWRLQEDEPQPDLKTTGQIIEHFYRHEYARLVALLTSRVGVRHLEDIEDAVQYALMTSSHTWPSADTPDNPTAWLYRVATNKLMSMLRQQQNRKRLLAANAQDLQAHGVPSKHSIIPHEIDDSMLRVLFLCCCDSLPKRSQLIAALKILCGFQAKEIAAHLHASESSIHKRYGRARESLKQLKLDDLDNLTKDEHAQRLDTVLEVLYAMFSAGHLSSIDSTPIRKELCMESMRLARLLTKHRFRNSPKTHALLALMHFHMARMETRKDETGALLLLEEQDRSLWSKTEIVCGLKQLNKAARGDVFSRFHAEAAIAAEHCIAPSFSETRWQLIVKRYELISKLSDQQDSVITLNHALALAEWKGSEAALELLKETDPNHALKESYIWSASLSDLYRRCNQFPIANEYRKKALAAAPSEAIKTLLEKRLSEANRR